MDHACSQCGAELGDGRFCPRCGHPAGRATPPAGATDTAQRRRVEVTPPAATTIPPPARFALFADEEEPATRSLPAYDEAAEPEPAHRAPHHRRAGAGWLPWLVGLAVLALIAGLGLWLLTGGDDEVATAPSSRDRDRERGSSPSADTTPTDDPSPSQAPPASTPTPIELAPFSAVSAPPPSDPSQDSSGNPVTFVADNMTDQVPETAWRTPGDATGETITVSLAERSVLREVGLVNGYAKVGQDAAGPLDWYHGNRRVLAVEWSFDDGTTLTQELGDTTAMQTVDVGRVRTQTVTLRLLEVSPPGPGRATRDYTAISELRILGRVG